MKLLISVRVNEVLLENLKSLASAQDRSVSYMVEKAIKEMVSRSCAEVKDEDK